MTRQQTTGIVLTVLVTASIAFAGTALAAESIAGGGAGSQGDLGGDPAADPDTVVSGNTTANHLFTFNVQEVSRDGSTDIIRMRFPDEMAEAGLSVNNVVVENAGTGGGVSISSSPNLVDGPDGDGIADTVRTAVSPTGGGTVRLNVQVDITTEAPTVETETDYTIRATVEDSAGTTAGPTQFATLTVVPPGGSTTTTTTATATPTETATQTETATMTETATPTETSTATETGTPDADFVTPTETRTPYPIEETATPSETVTPTEGDQTTTVAVTETPTPTPTERAAGGTPEDSPGGGDGGGQAARASTTVVSGLLAVLLLGVLLLGSRVLGGP